METLTYVFDKENLNAHSHTWAAQRREITEDAVKKEPEAYAGVFNLVFGSEVSADDKLACGINKMK